MTSHDRADDLPGGDPGCDLQLRLVAGDRDLREEVGTVADTGDGIAHVEGLPSAMTNELLEFPGGMLGVALNLDVHEIGAVILGPYCGIEEGQQVKRTGEILSVPVGDGFLGRVIDPWAPRSTASATSRPRSGACSSCRPPP